MVNGLSISEDEFKRLEQKDQNLILFKNQVHTIELINGYKLFYKVSSIIGSFIITCLGGMFYMIVEHMKG